MKNILFLLTGLLFFACAKHDGYVLNVEVSKAWDGKTAHLTTEDTDQSKVIDTAVIKNGKFRMKGKVEHPRMSRVTIYLNPNDLSQKEMIVSFDVVLENCEIRAICNPIGSESQFSISGSPLYELYNTHKNEALAMNARRKEVFRKYTDAYYKEGSTEKAYPLANEVSNRMQEIEEHDLNFVKENPSSMVSLFILHDFVIKSTEISRERMLAILETLSPELRATESGIALKRKIENRKMVVGDHFKEMELINIDGQPATISSMIKEGHHTMVEFWASWCVPCRGDIPYIRRAYKKYREKGFDVISISIDSDPAQWLKAVTEEKMEWSQLLDHNRYEHPDKSAYVAYGVTAVPTTFLLNDKGVVIAVDPRGAWLDLKLEEIFDETKKE